MTNEQIAKLRALAEKATPGPWDASGGKFGGSGRIWINATYPCINGLAAKFTVASVVMPDAGEVGYTDGAFNEEVACANAALIVALRNALPTILTALEALPVMREALEPFANGDDDVSDTAVIVGNGAGEKIIRARAALASLPKEVG